MSVEGLMVIGMVLAMLALAASGVAILLLLNGRGC
jgi:hypothetical protein